MNFEENRLKTFDASWPHSFIYPRALAKTGLYFVGQYDMVQCHFCNIRIHKWEDGDCIVLEHHRWSPRCPFLNCYTSTTNEWMDCSPRELLEVLAPVIDFDYSARNLLEIQQAPTISGTSWMDPSGGKDEVDGSNNQMDTKENTVNIVEQMDIEPIHINEDRTDAIENPANNSLPPSYDECGCQIVSRQIQMNSEINRLKTFEKSHAFINPKLLAKTGFFFTGPLDDVQCNFCDIQLNRWENDDNVVLEHYRFSPNCSFLKHNEKTSNIPIGSAVDLNELLAPVIYGDCTTPNTVNNKFLNFETMEEGYYTVDRISFPVVSGEKHARVDLQSEKFIILELNDEKYSISEKRLKALNSSNLIIMKLWLDERQRVGLFIYGTDEHPLYYQSSKLINMDEVINGYYKVLLFSIVKIDNQDRIRVDVYDKKHFIIPENRFKDIFDKLEWYNKQRFYVELDKWFDGTHTIHFYEEEKEIGFNRLPWADLIRKDEE